MSFLQTLRDRLAARREHHREHLLDRLAGGKHDFGESLPERAVVIDPGTATVTTSAPSN